MKTRFLIATSGVLLFSVAATAQVQGQQQQGDIFGQLLGAMFGNNQQASEQTLESDWNQGRRPFEQRRAQLDTRIDGAVRDGSLGRGEADQMRREYDEIVRLEAQYAADGNYSEQQRSDLRTRYRALSQRVGHRDPGQNGDQDYGQGYGQNNGQNGYQGNGQGNYNNDERWRPLATRSAEFERRVTAGLRTRDLTQAEATRLRADFRALGQIEAGYQRGGIDRREQADLQARYAAIDRGLDGGGGGSFGSVRDPARWTRLEARLAVAERNGGLGRSEAVHLRAQLNDLARLDAVYATGGYNADQRAYLGRRYGELDNRLGGNRR